MYNTKVGVGGSADNVRGDSTVKGERKCGRNNVQQQTGYENMGTMNTSNVITLS